MPGRRRADSPPPAKRPRTDSEHTLGGREPLDTQNGYQGIFRGKAAAPTRDGRYMVKALNVEWIPEPLLGKTKLDVHSNGRFGPADPLERPQMYSEAYPHLPWIPRRPPSSHPAHILWDCPTDETFIKVTEHSDTGFGTLKLDVVTALRNAIVSLDEPTQCLREELARNPDPSTLKELKRFQAQIQLALSVFDTPSTLNDCISLWGHLHRCYAELWAWLAWKESRLEGLVRSQSSMEGGIGGSGIMGAFTTSQATAAQLCARGAPCWYLVLRETALEVDTVVEMEKAVWGQPPFLRSVPGEFPVGQGQFKAIAEWSNRVVDIEVVPIPANYVMREEPARAVAEGSKRGGEQAKVPASRGHDRQPETFHELMPRRIHVWQKAMASLEVTSAAGPRLGQWVPEAELLVSSQQPWRLYAHLYNWFAVRQRVYFRLAREKRFEPPPPATWRNLLDTFPELSEEEKHKAEAKVASSSGKKGAETHARRVEERALALAFWEKLLGVPCPDRAPAPLEVIFRGATITAAALEQKPRLDMVTRAIRLAAWELSEVAFRVELYELDRRLTRRSGGDDECLQLETRRLMEAVFGGDHFAIPTIPPRDDRALGPVELGRRSETLEALRCLMVRWPGHPRHFDRLCLRRASSKDLADFESDAAEHYCQRFYDEFERVPVIPREFDPESMRSV